jgi:hypothetical protein
VQIEDVIVPLVEDAVARAFAAREEPQGFLDVAAAARFLSLSEEAVRTLAKRHKIPRVTLPNGRVRFEVERLRDWARGAS